MPAFALIKIGWNFAHLPYGSLWRAHRREFQQLVGQNAVAQYRPIIRHHTIKYLRGLLAAPENFLEQTKMLFGQTILHLAYGIKDEKDINELTLMAEENIRGHTAALIPGRYLKKEFDDLAEKTEEMTGMPFRDAKQRLIDGVLGDHPSLVNQLLERLPSKDDPDYHAREVIAKNVVAIAYVAGADTTLGTALGLILALAQHPEAQRRAQEEIDSVMGPGQLLDFDDLARLPYLQALLKEVVRMWPVTPLAIPHATSEDDVYKGFFIPGGTMTLANTWAIFRDPAHYPNPFEFRPDRFLKDGQLNPEVLDPESCGFGNGRRYLSQESLGFFAMSLLAKFDVFLSKDKTGNPIPPSYKPIGTIVVKPAPFDCRIVPRSSTHAALLAED
ncbi:cytochrome P450 [Coprinopsis sp. MPI-PUGE-AT-0042]|nr:cytochrome P450 [Coprinopsis sp. MPI-PUGE-AT-0042]